MTVVWLQDESFFMFLFYCLVMKYKTHFPYKEKKETKVKILIETVLKKILSVSISIKVY